MINYFRNYKLFFSLILAFLGFLSHGGVLASSCVEQELSLSSTGDFSAIVKEYTPSQYTNKLIIVVPPTGGENFIDRSYAKYFCRSGIRSIILSHWTGDDEVSFELDIHRRLYERGQLALDLLIDKNGDSEIGLLGSSVGALHVAISMARREEVKAAYMIVGGGDLASLIGNSEQEILAQARKYRVDKFQFDSREEYIEELSKIMPYEPLDKVFDRENKKIGMVISTNDDVVPTANQKKLYNKWAPESATFSGLGHTPLIIRTWLTKRNYIKKFFDSGLD